MERRDQPADVDPTDGTEDPTIGSRIAEGALERCEVLDRQHRKRTRPREPRSRA
jgi:hypothetical protein